jgi:hypothetical protein
MLFLANMASKMNRDSTLVKAGTKCPKNAGMKCPLFAGRKVRFTD